MTVGDRGFLFCDAKETNRLIERVLAGKRKKSIFFVVFYQFKRFSEYQD